uniref:Zn(2)-C6 fungal-type domain-containing protein n=1 Tax=Guillardia theta TaxID=55529 RepID=A0A7S4KVV6_GUITH|mmetsp:Transcript_3218/g.10879  ORF Transcript_3218/g.10879 Transcript_3218/m.10879 type:complete len:444 (+) Transcript_3218:125-1456(+)
MTRTQLACKPCKDARLKCDNFQPCTRCVASNMAYLCIRVRDQHIPRKRSSVACSSCKRSKLKCDENRPCSRCKRLHKEASCVDEELQLIPLQFNDVEEEIQDVQQLSLPPDHPARSQQLQVERPIDFWIRSLSFDRPSLLRERMNSMGWPDRVLARHWEFGFSSKELMNIFVSLPPYLQQVTRRALHAIEIIMADKMEKEARAPQVQLLMESEAVLEQDLELERALYGQQSFGVITQHLHPSTGTRAHVYISDAACRILGLHAEEALARIANREMSLVTTEFNYFCYVMFGTWLYATSPGRPFSLVGCIRDLGSSRESGCVVTRFVQQQEFDCHGRVKSMKAYILPLDKESFEASAEPPDSPFALFNKHMTGQRDYETLMNDFESDMFAGETILGMQKSKQGMERLEALGRDLERMYHPFVEHAERIMLSRRSRAGLRQVAAS